MTMTIAVAGKGGTGKTTVAALLCRALLARNVKPLLAVDADPNSCLPERLGVHTDRTIGQLREELRADPSKVPSGIAKSEWIERLINQEISESAGFDMIVMGRQEGPDCYCYINNLLRNCLAKISNQYQAVIIDNEAGLEHLSRRTDGKVDVMLVVCQPTLLGARTAQRIKQIMTSLKLKIGKAFIVLNQSEGLLSNELAAAFAETGLKIIGSIPKDPQAERFEIKRQSLLELPPNAPMAQAVNKLVGELLERKKA